MSYSDYSHGGTPRPWSTEKENKPNFRSGELLGFLKGGEIAGIWVGAFDYSDSLGGELVSVWLLSGLGIHLLRRNDKTTISHLRNTCDLFRRVDKPVAPVIGQYREIHIEVLLEAERRVNSGEDINIDLNEQFSVIPRRNKRELRMERKAEELIDRLETIFSEMAKLPDDERQEVEKRARDGLQENLETTRAAVSRLPREQQLTLIAEFEDKAQAPETPDISSIPPWRGVRKDRCSAIEYLEANYGNPEELRAKGLYSPTIRAHDPKLVDRVGKEARAQDKELSDFLPDRSDEVDDRAKAEGFDEQGRAVTGEARAVQATQRTITSRRSRERKKKAVSEAPTVNHS